ncbi:hypothetical protein ABMA28_001945 [Loxostege sticticalis]|uniref:Carboxylic ester hydrolase n=1 Tax=Loxostege sticticalis TaxID=481309 RepID=A0ABD0SZ75_LOXSC
MWGREVLVCVLVALARPALGQAVPSGPGRLVRIAQGQIRGWLAEGYSVYEYLNIPYATVPTGVNKFQAPLPPQPIRGTYHALDYNIKCPQPGITDHTEDCLVANVFTPSTVTEQSNLPVMVMIHGGGYQTGYGMQTTPRGLVNSHALVAVSFNYRLGAHGFLCLGTEDAPGNAGMKDMVALLQWVQTNIASFGGNPNNVTVWGCSSGGSAADLLVLSNMTNPLNSTEGLFHRVIAESGCSVAPFSTQMDPLENARIFAQRLNFTNVNNITALGQFYRNLSYENLTQFDFVGEGRNSTFFFQPCVERNISQERFLHDAPENILRRGDFRPLPTLYGYAIRDGFFRFELFNEWMVAMNDDFTDFLPADLGFTSEDQKVGVARMIKEFYFGKSKTVTPNNIENYVNYFSDVMFLHPVLRAVSSQVRAGNDQVYLFEYSFVTGANDTVDRGACEQVWSLMDYRSSPTVTPGFPQMSQTVRQLWYNFIATGHPTPPGSTSLPAWSFANENRSPYYSLGDTVTLVEGQPIPWRARIWDSVYSIHYRMPQPPRSAALRNTLSNFIWVYTLVMLVFIFK